MAAAVRLLCLVAAFTAVFTATGTAQQSTPPEPVLRITVNLVQVDAVVTDARGNPVTNLNANDFEVLEDGRPQTIKACVYIRTADATRTGLPTQAPIPAFAPHLATVDT
jgi:hypothetical protein